MTIYLFYPITFILLCAPGGSSQLQSDSRVITTSTSTSTGDSGIIRHSRGICHTTPIVTRRVPWQRACWIVNSRNTGGTSCGLGITTRLRGIFQLKLVNEKQVFIVFDIVSNSIYFECFITMFYFCTQT